MPVVQLNVALAASARECALDFELSLEWFLDPKTRRINAFNGSYPMAHQPHDMWLMKSRKINMAPGYCVLYIPRSATDVTAEIIANSMAVVPLPGDLTLAYSWPDMTIRMIDFPAWIPNRTNCGVKDLLVELTSPQIFDMIAQYKQEIAVQKTAVRLGAVNLVGGSANPSVDITKLFAAMVKPI